MLTTRSWGPRPCGECVHTHRVGRTRSKLQTFFTTASWFPWPAGMAQARPPRAGAGGGPVLGTWLEKTRTSDARESIEVGRLPLPLPPPRRLDGTSSMLLLLERTTPALSLKGKREGRRRGTTPARPPDGPDEGLTHAANFA